VPTKIRYPYIQICRRKKIARENMSRNTSQNAGVRSMQFRGGGDEVV
jgi:hypothetical protein